MEHQDCRNPAPAYHTAQCCTRCHYQALPGVQIQNDSAYPRCGQAARTNNKRPHATGRSLGVTIHTRWQHNALAQLRHSVNILPEAEGIVVAFTLAAMVCASLCSCCPNLAQHAGPRHWYCLAACDSSEQAACCCGLLIFLQGHSKNTIQPISCTPQTVG